MSYPIRAVEFFADCLGMRLTATVKNGIKGRARVRIPMTGSMRLVCPVEIVESCYRDKDGKVFVMVRVRQDLYLLIVYDVTLAIADMFALDRCRIETCGPDDSVFYRASVDTIMGRVQGAIVRTWFCKRGGKWQHLSVNSMV